MANLLPAAAAGIVYAKISKISDKAAATDKPSWSTAPVKPGQSPDSYAKQEMNKHYGAGKWVERLQPGMDFSELKKWAQRHR
jgi:hypothetical protein